LSLSLFIGSLVLGFWMDLGALRWIQVALISVSRFQTISLVLVVALIMIMSKIMKESGHMDRLVKSFTRLSKDARTVGSVMTALIGLLPMPGGALFSAPMVETSLSNHSVTSEQKTMLNYWFRHIWEYWWPLYPGVVLAVALLEVETWRYMIIMAPMTLFSVLAGVIFILSPIGKTKEPLEGELNWAGVKAFLWEIMPILIVILVIMIGAGVTGLMRLFDFPVRLPGTVSILPGLVASLIWVCAINRVPFNRLRSAVLDKGILPFLFLLLGIMVFKGTMIESQAVARIRDELMDYRIPVILVVMIMPFLSGLITGVAVGFVGTSFPLIIPMFPANPVFDYLSFAALAYTFGYMGMMLSPVHLCFLVTKDYYKASLIKSYRPLIKSSFMVMASALALFLITRVF
jgi:integral membrane protein (TIGR00529 family)